MAAPGYVVVANAAAGSTERSTVRQVGGRLAEEAPTAVLWTEGEDDFDAAVTGLDGRRLVVAGGDGTLHFALNRLAALGRLDEVVGLVPAGTGNDFARGAGIGTDVAAAVEGVLRGEPRWFPTIELDGGELAHNNAHFGLGLVAAERGTAWKPRLGHLAYPAATVAEGLTYDGEDVVVASGGETLFDGAALAVLVLLGPSMGGGVELVEDVVLDEPALEVVVIATTEREGRVADLRGRVGMAVDAVRNRLPERDDVRRWSLPGVTVRRDGGLRGDVDGEIRSWEAGVGLRIRPRTWRVVAARS